MTNWKAVKERWLPIVEKMEEHGMEDYAIPEIYRAACVANTELVGALEVCVLQIKHLLRSHDLGLYAWPALKRLKLSFVFFKRFF